MGAIQTVSEVFKTTAKCEKLRDRILAFLLVGLGKLGEHRKFLRVFFPFLIRRFEKEELVTIQFLANQQRMVFSMRSNEIGDLITGGEMLADPYRFPETPPTQIIDGGGNIGAFTIIAKAKFPDAKLISFEPDESNFELLRRNCNANGFEVELRQEALWNSNETRFFKRTASNLGFLSNDETNLKVQCTTPPSIKNPCWVKLDIEGAEHEVLPFIFRERQLPYFISMEIHHFDTKGQALIELLLSENYQVEGGSNSTVACCVVEAFLE